MRLQAFFFVHLLTKLLVRSNTNRYVKDTVHFKTEPVIPMLVGFY